MIVAISQPKPVNQLGLISLDLPEFDFETSGGGDVYIPTRFDDGNPTIYTGGGSGNNPIYPILPVNNNPTEPIQTVVTTSDPQPTTTDQPASNETPQQTESESTVTIDSNTLWIGGGIAAVLFLVLIVK